MHLLHRVAEFDTKTTENVALPSIVLGIHSRLYLLVVDDANPKRPLRLRRVERRPRLLNLRKKLLPMRKGVSETIKDIFCFEVPERLELEPFRDVVP